MWCTEEEYNKIPKSKKIAWTYKQLKYIQLFCKTARLFAEMSTCARLKVGAVVVKDNRIISTGFNGVPKGFKHCDESFKGKTQYATFDQQHKEFSAKYELHAEQNAIIYAAKNGLSVDGCTLYVTTAPCSNCGKLIVNAGIKEVFYISEYDRDPNGPNILRDLGLTVHHVLGKEFMIGDILIFDY